MRVVCVDDENLVVDLTIGIIREMPVVDDVVGFTDAREALEWFKKNNADIVLLDIDMPEITGIDMANIIKRYHPGISMIFLTGHAQYAMDAFELHASGYLLKPVSKQKLIAEIGYAASKVKSGDMTEAKVKIVTFGDFDVFVEGRYVSFSRSKAKELLAYLVDRQGRSVTRAEAFSVLYEDVMYDRPMQKQFDVVIRSLRQTLSEYGIDDILELARGNLRMKPEAVECDLFRFLEGNKEVMGVYQGQYMTSYSWASMTEGYLSDKAGI